MYVLFIRIFSNLMLTIISTSIVISKINQVSFSIIYLLWGIPIILINFLDIIFLIKSSLKKPENVDVRHSTILISLGSALALMCTSFFLKYPHLEIAGTQYLKALAALINVSTYPFVIWALLCLRSCLTVIPEAHKIVANGIYKYSRHPLYMCYIAWAIANILIFQSLPIIILTIIYIILTILRIKREENLLLETFPEYRDYYNNTGLLGIRYQK